MDGRSPFGSSADCRRKHQLESKSRDLSQSADEMGKILRCFDPKCPAIFRGEKELNYHFKMRHTAQGDLEALNKFKCKLCTLRHTQEELIKAHLEKHNASVDFYEIVPASLSCPDKLCPHKFYKEHHLKMHMVTHSGSKKYNCGICTYGVNKLETFQKHKVEHQQDKEKDPGLSGQSTSHERKANIHVAKTKIGPTESCVNKAKKNIKVKRFGVKWKWQAVRNGLLTEMELEQIRVGNPKFTYTSEKSIPSNERLKLPFRCLQCPRSYPCLDAWMLHQNKHEPNKYPKKRTFKCSICGLRTQREQIYRLHRCTLSRRDEWKQKGCGIKKRMNAQKRRNLSQKYLKGRRKVYIPTWLDRKRKPTGQRMNILKDGVLTLSEWKEIRRGNAKFEYKTSRTTVTGRQVNTPYRCLTCAMAFPRFSDWRKHQFVHGSGQDIYECNNCEFTTSSLLSFKKHSKIKHNILDLKNILLDPRNVKGSYDYESEDDNVNTVAVEGLIVSALRLNNIMGYSKHAVKPRNILFPIQGERRNGARTTCLVSCLLALGYDLALEMQKTSTICGAEINNIVKQGESYGWVEVDLHLESFPELSQEYGEMLTLKRIFRKGIELSAAEFEMSCSINSEFKVITVRKVKMILQTIVKNPFLLRIMVLGPENINYLTENFHCCEEIFWQMATRKAGFQRLKALQREISEVTTKMVELKAKLLKLAYELCKASNGVTDVQLIAYDTTAHSLGIKEYKILNQRCIDLLEEKETLIAGAHDHILEMNEQMRSVFSRYLTYLDPEGKYLKGDISLDLTEGKWTTWIKEASGEPCDFEMIPESIYEETRIWEEDMSLETKKLAVLGVVLAFWEVMDCYSCPIVFADAYSTSDLKFNLDEAVLSAVMDFTYQAEAQGYPQIWISLSENYPKINTRKIQRILEELKTESKTKMND